VSAIGHDREAIHAALASALEALRPCEAADEFVLWGHLLELRELIDPNLLELHALPGYLQLQDFVDHLSRHHQLTRAACGRLNACLERLRAAI
jgi:hypothetical protein